MKFIISSFLISLLSYNSISNNNFSEELNNPYTKENLTPNTLKIWEEHLKQVEKLGELQSECEPFYKLAEGKTLGNVLFFHGYTACPQQFKDISEILAKKGYNVFVPLLPGHGKVSNLVNNEIIDDDSLLPEVKDIAIYDNFAKNMGALLKDENGEKIIGGLSVGGVIAAKALIYNQSYYDRAVLMTPFFSAAGDISPFIPFIGAIIPNTRMSWGEDCEEQRRLGRSGYCNFKIGKVAAVRKFGTETLKQVNKITKPVQILGVEDDPAASNSAIAEAIKNIPNAKGCLFKKGTPHSMLSRKDNPHSNLFWLNALEEQLVDFIDYGKNFDEIGSSQNNLPACRYE
ncbi:MAG: alpha/beta fold hydrolase [Candidatus Sericytochromatia bacterium]